MYIYDALLLLAILLLLHGLGRRPLRLLLGPLRLETPLLHLVR
mgnify:CR=1 FL=1|jgi:hypothetical protein